MFDPVLAKCLRSEDFVAIAADADALSFGQSMITQTDSTPWSYDQIVKDSRFGRTIADAFYSAIVASGSPAAAILFVNFGIDLSLTATQAGLGQVATLVPSLATTCDSLKSLGVWRVSVFASRGVTWSPSVSDIASHRAANVAAANWEQLANNTIPTLLDHGASWAEIKTAINGVT